MTFPICNSKTICIVLILSTTLFTSGCPVPIPPGYNASSRENIDEETKQRLVAGVTTFEDVLLLLGEPDEVGANDSWLAYGSIHGEGGLLFLFCAGGGCMGGGSEKMEYHRLIVSFDENGVMTTADFVSKECWEGIFGFGSSGERSAPCIQVYAPPK